MVRRKTIPDERVLDALRDAMMACGPAGLTFARASAACGLAQATLVQRYGDRRTMVEAVLLRAWDRLDAATQAADAEEPLTPDGAVEMLLRLMPPRTAARDLTDGLLLLREDIANPVLRARGAAWGDRLAVALGRRIAAEGERAVALGWQMARLWQGALIWWAFTRDEPAETAVRRALTEWIETVKKRTD